MSIIVHIFSQILQRKRKDLNKEYSKGNYNNKWRIRRERKEKQRSRRKEIKSMMIKEW